MMISHFLALIAYCLHATPHHIHVHTQKHMNTCTYTFTNSHKHTYTHAHEHTYILAFDQKHTKYDLGGETHAALTTAAISTLAPIHQSRSAFHGIGLEDFKDILLCDCVSKHSVIMSFALKRLLLTVSRYRQMARLIWSVTFLLSDATSVRAWWFQTSFTIDRSAPPAHLHEFNPMRFCFCGMLHLSDDALHRRPDILSVDNVLYKHCVNIDFWRAGFRLQQVLLKQRLYQSMQTERDSFTLYYCQYRRSILARRRLDELDAAHPGKRYLKSFIEQQTKLHRVLHKQLSCERGSASLPSLHEINSGLAQALEDMTRPLDLSAFPLRTSDLYSVSAEPLELSFRAFVATTVYLRQKIDSLDKKISNGPSLTDSMVLVPSTALDRPVTEMMDSGSTSTRDDLVRNLTTRVDALRHVRDGEQVISMRQWNAELVRELLDFGQPGVFELKNFSKRLSTLPDFEPARVAGTSPLILEGCTSSDQDILLTGTGYIKDSNYATTEDRDEKGLPRAAGKRKAQTDSTIVQAGNFVCRDVTTIDWLSDLLLFLMCWFT